MAEYLKYRCCMCPNIGKETEICPMGPLKYEETKCRFVKSYVDDRGWRYKVMPGIGKSQFKARYQDNKHTGAVSWKGLRALQWRDTFDEAQSDLNVYAKIKDWRENNMLLT